MIHVAIRLDDPSANSNHEIEEKIIAILETLSIPATFAVIPFRTRNDDRLELNAANARHIIEAAQRGSIEVALHGHSHIRRALGAEQSEFRGLPIDWQYQLLTEVTSHMRSLFGASAVQGFVPPWNSLDSNTLKVLKVLGFEYAAVGRTVTGVGGKAIKELPMTCSFVDLEDGVAEARRSPDANCWIMPLLHVYDFEEDGQADPKFDLGYFSSLLEKLREQPDIQFHRSGELVHSTLWTSLAKGIRRRSLSRRLPWRIRARFPKFSISDLSLWKQMDL